MSAFFIAINRDQQPFQRSVAELMLGQLDRFGCDGKELVVQDNFAIGYQRLWTVPEEQGERQPIYDADRNSWLVFYGRIDNRKELCDCLDIRDEVTISDARLLLALYHQFGESIFKRILGPFVFVFYFPSTGNVIAARDAMGGRYLVYKITEQTILIASYEMAIVAHPSIDYQFNDEKVARILANMMDDNPASMIAGIEPLHPGQQLDLSNSHTRLTTFYLPDPNTRIRLGSDQAYADEFKSLLKQAVQRRLRSIKPIGTMLSGGFDSVPISILAAQLLNQQARQLKSFSWVFDKYPEADERRYSATICEDFSIQPHWINCDTVWPQFDDDTHCNPIMPFSTPYSEFNQRLFKQARTAGVGVMLSGIGGDMLYTGTESILYELLKVGRIKDAILEARRLLTTTKGKGWFIKRYLLSPVLRRWVENRRLKRSNEITFLTDKLQQQLINRPNYLIDKQLQSLRPAQYFNTVGAYEGEDASYGKYMEAKYGLERRFPFRDRDLVEFMLAIPSDQLSFALEHRPIVKRAFKNEFQSALIARNSKTDFTSVIIAGVKTDKRYMEWFSSEGGEWQKYVKQCYFTSASSSNDGVAILKWRCAYYQFWKTVCYTPLKAKLGLVNEGLVNEKR